jgi:phosphoglycolate phosphatase-like HAD superfamily hydrolase
MVALIFQEKEEEKKRMSSQKKTADEERVRLLNEQRQREQDRIRREIEEKNKAEAKKLLEDLKKAGKKHVVVEGVRNSCYLAVNSTGCYLCDNNGPLFAYKFPYGF